MTNLRTSFSRAALKLSTAFIVIGAIVSGAAAQNLIQNSGFDVGPPTACGNNLPNPTGWPIPPWNVTGASKSNVVVVDDNVSCLYGNLGPQKDASAPGSGIKQYYLDIANGQNKFYQSFTVPSCSSAPDGSTATVTFGGYFSSRENLVGTGTIWLHQGVGDTGTIIATLPVTIPAGPSQTTPWTHVTGTASVVRGATFSYVVFMDNNVNFDNAHLTIDADACNPPPPPPPPPPVTQCLDAKGDVTCNPDGTVSVTITATNFSGSDITVTSLTPGVTVTTPQQPWAATTTWTLAGATPGQTVKLSVNGTKTGGGSAPGTDQCCGTEITVVIPACQQPPPPPLGELIVVKKVVYNGPLVMPSLTYPVTVTCGTWNKTFNLIHNVPQSEGNVPQASCSAAEALPPAPAGACDPNKTATWQTPVVAQATSGITTTITVTNTLDCLPNENGQLGSLTIKKMVVNNTSPQISTNGIVFPISVSCQSGMSPAVVTPMPLNDQGSQTINGLAFGTSCQVTEGSPGPFPPQPFLCMNNMVPTWTKNFVSSGTVSISGAHTVTVQNILDCKPEGGGHGDPNKGYMRVEKTIQNDANASLGALQALTFPVTVTCDGNATPVSVKLTQAGVVTGIPVTTTCTALEGAMPPPPAGSCPSGQVPAWMPPETYTPASVTISSGAGPVITIKNTLACRPEGGGSIGTPPPLPPPPPPSVKCKAPLIAEGKACVCPAGTRKRGSTCVKPVVCHAPATLNKNGTACVCPRGMVRKGSTCVRKEQPKQDGPRITPNDVIRVVPGIIGPGFGGGGDRKGGGGGDRKGGGGSGAGGPAGVR